MADCDAHPGTAEVARCKRCDASVCSACRKLDGMHTVCASCLKAIRRAPWIRLAVGVPLACAIGFGGYTFYKQQTPPFDYGASTGSVRKLEAQLAAEPCDRPKAIALLTEVLRAGNSREVLKRADAFETACGPYLELRTLTYQAHDRLGETDAAIADLTKLVDAEPSNPNYRGWRGVAYEAKHDDANAATDFEKALALEPSLSDIPLNLTTVYERLGRPCDALAPLNQLVQRYPDRPWTGDIRARMEDLTRKGHCAAVTASIDRVSLKTPPGQRDMRVDVRVNDTEAGSFVVDTGASEVTLTRAAADNAHVNLQGARTLRLQTANGERSGLFVTLRSIDVKGLKAERVTAVVVDDLGPGVAGLLGMSFLGRFDLRKENGAFEIRARQAAARP